MTYTQRRVAAARVAAQGLQPGTATPAGLAPTPGGTPDYFGPYPNFANSPLPTEAAPKPVVFYFAEGTCRPNFDPHITILNPGTAAAAVTITYMKGDGTTKNQVVSVPARSRGTVHPSDVLGVADDAAHDFSSMVECTNGQQIVAERPMYFNFTGNGTVSWTGGSDAMGALRPAITWHFAEGTCRPNFDPYICIENPGEINDLGQYIPLAVPDTTSYPGSDYYEIELGQYREKLHGDLPSTLLRGYRQTNSTDPKVTRFSYSGPMIVSRMNRPVRVKFTNKLPTGTGGNLFIPVDTTVMGAGMGPDGMNDYTQNRASVHLHGGNTPWISDGTPNQWITPASESTPYPQGVSVRSVPDMPALGPGQATFFYTNEQSARLMFYHDHAYGITRLNVYAVEAAGYIVTDPAEQGLINNKVIPADQIPLIVKDKTFVPDDAQLAKEDPTWDKTRYGGKGNLWFPHVYIASGY